MMAISHSEHPDGRRESLQSAHSTNKSRGPTWKRQAHIRWPASRSSVGTRAAPNEARGRGLIDRLEPESRPGPRFRPTPPPAFVPPRSVRAPPPLASPAASPHRTSRERRDIRRQQTGEIAKPLPAGRIANREQSRIADGPGKSSHGRKRRSEWRFSRAVLSAALAAQSGAVAAASMARSGVVAAAPVALSGVVAAAASVAQSGAVTAESAAARLGVVSAAPVVAQSAVGQAVHSSA